MAVSKDQPGTPHEYQKKGETVTNRARILGLLRRLIETRSLVSVRLPSSREPFNSAILEADAERDLILLDELTPVAGHKALLKGRRLQVRARLKGVDIHFSGRLVSAGSEGGVAFYRLPFPKSIEYHQMRAYFRAQPSMGQPVSVRLRPPARGRDQQEVVPDILERMVAEGHLFDISQGGICAVISEGAVPFRAGSVLACALSMPDGEPLHCEVEIRNLGEEPRSGHPRIGARFVNLTPKAANRIAQLVLSIQREMIRKQGR